LFEKGGKTKGLCDSSPFLTSPDEKWAAIIGFDILQASIALHGIY
jgi:hypothetical protein